ncbi:MAG TPA: cupin domain-containing protein [Actinomycetota bacterium]|nr:cupin domain-containing protein [Actinomycetota bacterium]
MSSNWIRLIRKSDRLVDDSTAGMIREAAVTTDGMWAGLVRTKPGMASGWHHHGEYETAIFVVSGRLRMEFGPGGREIEDAEAGDFLYVPKGAIHRESNPLEEEGTLIAARSGTGPPVINVDGPEPAE